MSATTTHEREPASISALSRRSGLSVATIKYYIREGLIRSNQDLGADEAEIVDQLKLIRGLVHVVGLSIQQVREVLNLVRNPTADPATSMTSATMVLPLAGARVSDPISDSLDFKDAREALASVGFDELPDAPYVAQLLSAITLAGECGAGFDTEHLAAYSRAARECAEADFKHLPLDSPIRAAQVAVLGTAIYGPVLVGLRRLAHRELTNRLPTAMNE
ncbi:MAG: MerR family transcriptional regulator [Propionibacteriaceae bacterium]|nr:MerR family transcriptional regulator [Propionibacteriaceae bacterium]